MKNCLEEVHNGGELFNHNCKKCGNVTVYADDAVFTTASRNRMANQARLSEMMVLIQEFLQNNRITMNPLKTILCEYMIKPSVSPHLR